MATIFRGRIITAVAVLSTTVAINAQPAPNRLALITPPAQKPTTLNDFPNPARPLPQPYIHDVRNRLVLDPPPTSLKDFPTPASIPRGVAVYHHRPQFTPVASKPPGLREFPNPVAPSPLPFIQDVRNRHVFLPTPTPQPPFAQSDWPTALPPIRSIVADAILNPDTFILKPSAAPFAFSDWTLPAQTFPQPRGVHYRPELSPVIAPPFLFADWVRPAVPGPQILVEPFRNGLVLPVPVAGTPFSQHEWVNPAQIQLKPETFLFYYIQDQTKPAFINYDWPIAPKLPSLTWDFVPNRLLFPFIATPAPFRQADWPNASMVQIAKIIDPYNRNVFLPIPQGQPTNQLDWPRPRDPLSLQGSHTINDIPLLTRLIVNPVIRNYDWPLPSRCMLLSIMWEKEGTSPIYLPTFRREWAENINQIVGPWAPQPETH